MARSKAVYVLSLTIIFLVFCAMSSLGTGTINAANLEPQINIMPVVFTDNGTSVQSYNQEAEEEVEARQKQADQSLIESWNTNDKIYPSLKTLLNNMKPTDDITVIVMLRMDEDTTNDNSGDTVTSKILEATAPIDKECSEIGKEIMQRDDAAWEEFVSEVGDETEARELIDYYTGDPEAKDRYLEIRRKYGADEDSRRILQQEIENLKSIRNEKVNAILQQQFGAGQVEARQAIEALPDTKVIGDTLDTNSLDVRTKVYNIAELINMPEVVRIYGNAPVLIADNIPVITLHSPANGSLDYTAINPSFSWQPFKQTTKYQFVLAKNADMTQAVEDAAVSTTYYEFNGVLDYNTNYFWRVMALEPAPSDWSATFSFQTEVAPPPPPDVTPEPFTWKIAILVLIGIALAAASGAAIWLIISKRRKSKG
jgi:hypothetical protein